MRHYDRIIEDPPRFFSSSHITCISHDLHLKVSYATFIQADHTDREIVQQAGDYIDRVRLSLSSPAGRLTTFDCRRRQKPAEKMRLDFPAKKSTLKDHTMHVPSKLAVASLSPPGAHATDRIVRVCPSSTSHCQESW